MTSPPELRLYDPLTDLGWTSGDPRVGAAAQAAGIVSDQGLDVANFQGSFPWASVKAHYPALGFGIYKMTEGLTFTDGFAAHNHDAIKAAGLVHGAYHFLRPENDGIAQAQFFVAQHHKIGLTDDDMLWVDNEVTDNRTPGQVATCAKMFMTELDRLCPRNPKGVYTMISFATGGENAGLGKWPLWLAFPGSRAPVPPPPWARWTFWQWGLRQGVDADAFNGTATQLATWLASFRPKPVPTAGPVRHLTQAGDTMGGIAAARNTTVAHIAEVSATAYTTADLAALEKAKLPAGIAWYSSN
jgi:lysozyme